MVRTRGFLDDARHALFADSTDNGCKSLAVICSLQRLTVNKTVQIDMVFRDDRADGNIRIFSHLACLSPEPKARVSVPGDLRRWGQSRFKIRQLSMKAFWIDSPDAM